MAYKVVKTFKHKNTGRLWRAGSEFDGTEAQALELEHKGFVEVRGEDSHAEPNEVPGGGAPAAEQGQELGGMTVKELQNLCADLGIDAPKKATKAKLVALIGSARGGSPEAGGGNDELPEGA